VTGVFKNVIPMVGEDAVY